jgi:hypothetical protein
MMVVAYSYFGQCPSSQTENLITFQRMDLSPYSGGMERETILWWAL